MKEPTSLLNAQAAALLENLRRHQVERTNEILDRAQDGSRRIVREAFAQSRQRARAAIEEERRRLIHAERTASMQQETRKRLEGQQHALLCSARGWDLLVEALRRRWTTASSRIAWCRAAVAQAAALFESASSQVEHAPGLSAEELGGLRELPGADARLRLTERVELEAGIVIHTAGAALDASLQGLLADRGRIEGELLAALLPAGTLEPSPGPGADP